MNINIVHYGEIDSTNAEARRLSKDGAESGMVVTAKSQTAGKGRRGRSWESPAEENLYFSLLLKPAIVQEHAPMLTLIMAYSVAKILQKEEIHALIKWPNDLVLSGKKVCGILTEMNLSGTQVEDVIIVNSMNFSEELKDKATSLRKETLRELECGDLLSMILDEFSKHYEMFLDKQNLEFLQEDYNFLLVNRDREVMVLELGKEYLAKAIGINKQGELLVQRDNGSTEAVFAGEVSVRGIYGYV